MVLGMSSKAHGRRFPMKRLLCLILILSSGALFAQIWWTPDDIQRLEPEEAAKSAETPK